MKKSQTSAQSVASNELRRFLMDLPKVDTNRKGYRREELQIRLPKDMSDQLKILSGAISVSDLSGGIGSPAVQLRTVGMPFRPDQLVVHLVNEFLQSYRREIEALTAGFDPARDQANQSQELFLKCKQLLDTWPQPS